MSARENGARWRSRELDQDRMRLRSIRSARCSPACRPRPPKALARAREKQRCLVHGVGHRLVGLSEATSRIERRRRSVVGGHRRPSFASGRPRVSPALRSWPSADQVNTQAAATRVPLLPVDAMRPDAGARVAELDGLSAPTIDAIASDPQACRAPATESARRSDVQELRASSVPRRLTPEPRR